MGERPSAADATTAAIIRIFVMNPAAFKLSSLGEIGPGAIIGSFVWVSRFSAGRHA
jgi:hypothetical protein